jgi:peptidase inhibitor family I36
LLSTIRSSAARAAIGVTATVLAVGGVALAEAGPASAAGSDCPNGDVCFWDAPNYSGEGRFIPINGPSGWGGNIEPAWNDRASSIVNRSGRTITFFFDNDQRGPGFPLPPNGWAGNLGSFDNQISSLAI